jgi:hypothetical protein
MGFAGLAKYFDFVRVFAPPFTPLYIEGNCLALRILKGQRQKDVAAPWIAVKRGIRMPTIMIDEFLLMIIVAGMGLTVAYLRAEYVLHKRFNAAEHEKLSVQHELHANRLKPKQIDVPMAVLQNHEHFLRKESAFRAPAESAPTVYSRKSTDIGMAQLRELA